MQLVPSLKQSIVTSAKSLFAERAKTNFMGVMDKEIDPTRKVNSSQGRNHNMVKKHGESSWRNTDS
jgi:hypothetical protein